MRRSAGPALLLLLVSCQPPPIGDILPPRLVEAGVSADGTEVALEFDEPVAEARTGGDFSPEPSPPSVTGTKVALPLPADLKPGKPYQWTAEVEDKSRNLTSLAGRFYGPNAHPAGLRLNEIRIAGSGVHPDFAELRVETAGSLGGWTLEIWSGPSAPVRKILPDVTLEPGALVVVHGKAPEGPGSADETEAPDTAGGPETGPEAWDFWVSGGKGLPGTKGLVVLRPAPGAPAAEALLYSAKPGEGAALAEAAGWPGREELDPRGCTATRTWCRAEGPGAGWVLVANGTASPGKANRLTPWEGPTSSRKGTPKTKGRKRGPRDGAPGPKQRSGPGSRPARGPEDCRPPGRSPGGG